MTTTDGTMTGEYKLDPCQICGMYRLCTLQELLLLEQCSDFKNLSWGFTCPTCVENCTLQQHILQQNNIINSLHERISSLVNIHNLEKDVDEMTAQFASLTTVDASICSNKSSDQLDLNVSNIDKFIQNKSFESESNISELSCLNITPVQEYYPTVLPVIPGVILPEENENILSKENTGLLQDTQVVSDSVIIIDDDLPDLKTKEISVTEKFKENTIVRTMIAGDSSLQEIRHLKSSLLHTDSNNWFKVAPKNAMLQDLIDTVLYFATRVHKNLKTVILQVTKSQIDKAGTEVTKRALIGLLNHLVSKGISLIILSPVPYLKYTDISFSRALAIAKWLWTIPDRYTNASIIDITTDLSPNKLFTDNGSKLSYTAIKLLELKINNCQSEN